MTTPASQADVSVMEPLHQDLEARQRLPSEHYVDSAYVNAELMLELPQQYDLTLVARVRETPVNTTPDGQPLFMQEDFFIDWEHKQVVCPNHAVATTWTETTDRRGKTDQHKHTIKVRFPRKTCQVCPLRAQCTTSKTNGRSLQFPAQQVHETVLAARKYQKTHDFKQKYKRRAGVEGTISTVTNHGGLRVARYVGHAKTHLQAILAASAYNVFRWFDHTHGKPVACTRPNPIKMLVA